MRDPAPFPFVLSVVEARAPNAAAFGTSFDCAQDERVMGSPAPGVTPAHAGVSCGSRAPSPMRCQLALA